MSSLERAAELPASLVVADCDLQAIPFMPLMGARLRTSNAWVMTQDSEPDQSFFGSRKFIDKSSFYVELDVAEIALGGPRFRSRTYPSFYGVRWDTVHDSEGRQT